MRTRTHIYIFLALPEKVQSKISINSAGCWLWQGELNRNGYGRCWFQGAKHMAHRLIWALTGRELVSGHHLDHLCRERACCNPTHLSSVLPRQNTHRGRATLYN